MSVIGGVSSLLVLAATLAAQPTSSACQEMLALKGPEMSLEISLEVRDENLGSVFQAIGERSGVQFEVAPKAAGLRATLSVENVPVRSILELLATNLRLSYVARLDRIAVEVRPEDDPGVPGYAFSFETVVDGRRQRWPALGTRIGLCGVLKQRLSSTSVYSLHCELPMVEEHDGGDQLTVSWCVKGASGARVSMLFDVTVVRASEDGRREWTERRLIEETIPLGTAAASIFLSDDGRVSVAVVGLARSAGPAGAGTQPR